MFASFRPLGTSGDIMEQGSYPVFLRRYINVGNPRRAVHTNPFRGRINAETRFQHVREATCRLFLLSRSVTPVSVTLPFATKQLHGSDACRTALQALERFGTREDRQQQRGPKRC